MEITFIDLFCGIGGFRLALESLGAKCVFSCDTDRQARKTYQANIGEMPEGDILTFSVLGFRVSHSPWRVKREALRIQEAHCFLTL